MNDSIERVMVAGVELLASMTVGLLDSDGHLIKSRPGNNGVQYITPVFAIRDYCWCDFGEFEEEPPDPATSIHTTADGHCPPNFEHFASGVSLSWYKYFGRNEDWRELPSSREAAISILLDCMKPLVARTPSLPRELRRAIG